MWTFYLVPGTAWGLCFTVRHLVQGGRLLLTSGTPAWQPLGRWAALGVRQGFPIFFSLKSPRCGLRPLPLHGTQEKAPPPSRFSQNHWKQPCSQAPALLTAKLCQPGRLVLDEDVGTRRIPATLACRPGTPSLRWGSTWLLSALM